MRRQGQPIPAGPKSKILSRFYPYSPELTESELELAFAIIASIGRISDDEPLAGDIVDGVIGWMIAKGWGEQVLVQSSRDANLDSAQFERLIDGLFAREEPPDYARRRTIERVVEEGELSAADINRLGERLLGESEDAERQLLIDWLLRAKNAGKLDQSPVAMRALLFNAHQVRFARKQLAPFLDSNSDPELLQHLAALAIAEDSADLANLLMSTDLPDELLLSLEPLAASNDRNLRFTIANAIAQRFGAGTNGTEWLLSRSEDPAAPELLRIMSLRQLAEMESTPQLREAFLKHYNGDIPSLRVEALRALRAYELPQAFLESATLEADAELQREAWRQLDRRFDKSTPISTKWRLYPYSRNEDIGMALGAVAAVSAAIMGLTALITPVLAAAFWKSLALFLVGAAASAASWGFLLIVAIASQHQNGFADKNIQQILYVIIAVLWLIIGISWFSAVPANRQRPANNKPEMSHEL
jgi:hypothetical protein